MTKNYKNRSGIYFRGVNQNTGEIESICFEELTADEQINVLDGFVKIELEKMCLLLAKTINEIK